MKESFKIKLWKFLTRLGIKPPKHIVLEYAYRQTEGISDKNVQSVTFLMIKDNIVRGSRMMREAINDLNKKSYEQESKS